MRQFGRQLETHYQCGRCDGPVSEYMLACPWCGTGRKVLRDETTFPSCCPRCQRGTKLDWRYCAWCYGPGFDDVADRAIQRPALRGTLPQSANCDRDELMPFMRYCPWCHTKVRQTVENRRQHRHLLQMRLGRRARFLDALPVVCSGAVRSLSFCSGEPGRPRPRPMGRRYGSSPGPRTGSLPLGLLVARNPRAILG